MPVAFFMGRGPLPLFIFCCDAPLRVLIAVRRLIEVLLTAPTAPAFNKARGLTLHT